MSRPAVAISKIWLRRFLAAIALLALLATIGLAQHPEANDKPHWSERRAQQSCSIWVLYSGHERVAHVQQCPGEDADYFSVMEGGVFGVFDDLEAAKKRCEEVYKHRNQENAPREKPAKLGRAAL